MQISIKQESTPVGCVPPAHAYHTCFNSQKMPALCGGPQVNKFQQVSSDGHQMSLTKGPGQEPRGPCTVRSHASWILVTWGGTLLDRQTDTTENITFLQLRSWPVIKVVGIFQKLVMIGRKALGKFQKCDRT